MTTTADRFWQKVRESDGCWIWEAGKTQSGYGLFSIQGRMKSAHRFAYEHLIGPIPEGLQLDHLCRTRACVNPYHLDPVPNAVNAARGAASRSACRQGHTYDADNSYYSAAGVRKCRACRAARAREGYWRAKAAA